MSIWGGWVLSGKSLVSRKETVVLSSAAARVVGALLGAEGRTVSVAVLTRAIGGGATQDYLRTIISEVRKLCGKDAIKNYRNIGAYQMIAVADLAKDGDIEWAGWKLSGKLLLEPRRVWLRDPEVAILREFMKVKGAFLEPKRLHELAGSSDTILATTISRISTLRDALGLDAIITSRTHGYRLTPAYKGRGGGPRHPIEEIIEGLEHALEAAKRFRSTLKQDEEREVECTR